MTNATDEVLYPRLAIYANANLLDNLPKVVGMYSLFPRETAEVLATLWNTPQPPSGLADFLAVSHINMPGKATHWQYRPTHLPWVTVGAKPVFADATTVGGRGIPARDGCHRAIILSQLACERRWPARTALAGKPCVPGLGGPGWQAEGDANLP